MTKETSRGPKLLAIDALDELEKAEAMAELLYQAGRGLGEDCIVRGASAALDSLAAVRAKIEAVRAAAAG